MALSGSDIATLYERHATAVLRFAMRRTFDAQVSVDIVGETFAIAFEKRRKFRGSTDAEAVSWLTGIASNLMKMYFRNGAIERRAMQRMSVEPVIVASEEFERIEALAGLNGLRDAVRDALIELSEDQRVAVELRVVEELPYTQVAERLDVSEEVARARVSRGLKKLRDRIEAERFEEVTQNV